MQADFLAMLLGDVDPDTFWLEMDYQPPVRGESSQAILRRTFDDTGHDQPTDTPPNLADLQAALLRARGAIARARVRIGMQRLAANRQTE